MKEISKVLKPEGLLIAPTFLWKELTLEGKLLKFFMMKKTFRCMQNGTKNYIQILIIITDLELQKHK